MKPNKDHCAHCHKAPDVLYCFKGYMSNLFLCLKCYKLEHGEEPVAVPEFWEVE